MTTYFVLCEHNTEDAFSVKQVDGPDTHMREADIVDIMFCLVTGTELLFELSNGPVGDYWDVFTEYYSVVVLPIEPTFEDEVALYWETTITEQLIDSLDSDASQDVARMNIMADFVSRYGEQVAEALDIAAETVLNDTESDVLQSRRDAIYDEHHPYPHESKEETMFNMLVNRNALADYADPSTGEVIVEKGDTISPHSAHLLISHKLASMEVALRGAQT